VFVVVKKKVMLNMKWYWWVLIAIIVLALAWICYNMYNNKKKLATVNSSINDMIPETGAHGYIPTRNGMPIRGSNRLRNMKLGKQIA
jgi:hypothetical protein